jgi:hypothetical protein
VRVGKAGHLSLNKNLIEIGLLNKSEFILKVFQAASTEFIDEKIDNGHV